MDAAQLTELAAEFKYILARISKYLKNNQYVYLRAFDSWLQGYNSAAARLNAEKTLTVPIFKLGPIDYSPSGKSIRPASVDKFIKTISHQIIRLEDKVEELNKSAAKHQSTEHPLEKFFSRDSGGTPVVPQLSENRVFVAIPAGEAHLGIFWQGIQPALEIQGLSFFRADRALLDDSAFCELCQELLSCRLAIFDLSGQAANVMLALGLAYGIGKPVVILQQQQEMTLGGVNNLAYVRYAGAAEIKTALCEILPQLLASDMLNQKR
jgi:hypothetical protein